MHRLDLEQDAGGGAAGIGGQGGSGHWTTPEGWVAFT
jgi:hypothetical protein